MKLRFLALIIVLFILGCKSSKELSSDEITAYYNENITVLDLSESVPKNSKFIRTIEVKEVGRDRQDNFYRAIAKLKRLCEKEGANYIKITELRNDEFLPLKLKVDILYIDQTNIDSQSKKNDKTAVIYFYRPDQYYGSAGRFRIVNSKGEIVQDIKNNDKFKNVTSNLGKVDFYSPKLGKNQISIELQSGQEYYVECRFYQKGWTKVVAAMTLQSSEIGREGYLSTEQKN